MFFDVEISSEFLIEENSYLPLFKNVCDVVFLELYPRKVCCGYVLTTGEVEELGLWEIEVHSPLVGFQL